MNSQGGGAGDGRTRSRALRPPIHLETVATAIAHHHAPFRIDLDGGRPPESLLGRQIEAFTLQDQVEVSLHPFLGPSGKAGVAEERHQMGSVRPEYLDAVVAPI